MMVDWHGHADSKQTFKGLYLSTVHRVESVRIEELRIVIQLQNSRSASRGDSAILHHSHF
jgi:hypothetical protein